MTETPVLPSPVSTTAVAPRQYRRGPMAVQASPNGYIDTGRHLLSRTAQIAEDQLHLQRGKDALPRPVACISKLTE